LAIPKSATLDDAVFGRVREGRGDLPHDFQRLGRVHDLCLLKHLEKRSALDELHYNVKHPAELARVVDLHDVIAPYERHGLRLAEEPLHVLRVLGEGGKQHLDRHGPAQAELEPAVDRAHAALPELVEYFAPGELAAHERVHRLLNGDGRYLRRSGLERLLPGVRRLTRIELHAAGMAEPRLVDILSAAFGAEHNSHSSIQKPRHKCRGLGRCGTRLFFPSPALQGGVLFLFPL
jgi:hypothetical protein